MTPLDQANLLAGHAVAHATAYLEGRHDAARLQRDADALIPALLALHEHPETNAILDPVRLLTVAMMRTARVAELAAEGWRDHEARLARWIDVMDALIRLVRHESRALGELAGACEHGEQS